MDNADSETLVTCFEEFLHRTQHRYIGIDFVIDEINKGFYEAVFRFKEFSDDA